MNFPSGIAQTFPKKERKERNIEKRELRQCLSDTKHECQQIAIQNPDRKSELEIEVQRLL